jgi:hypothetical protein
MLRIGHKLFDSLMLRAGRAHLSTMRYFCGNPPGRSDPSRFPFFVVHLETQGHVPMFYKNYLYCLPSGLSRRYYYSSLSVIYIIT